MRDRCSAWEGSKTCSSSESSFILLLRVYEKLDKESPSLGTHEKGLIVLTFFIFFPLYILGETFHWGEICPN